MVKDYAPAADVMGVILHARQTISIAAAIGVIAVSAVPASAQAPGPPEQPAPADPVGALEGTATEVVGGAVEGVAEAPETVTETVAVVPHVVGGTLDTVEDALAPVAPVPMPTGPRTGDGPPRTATPPPPPSATPGDTGSPSSTEVEGPGEASSPAGASDSAAADVSGSGVTRDSVGSGVDAAPTGLAADPVGPTAVVGTSSSAGAPGEGGVVGLPPPREAPGRGAIQRIVAVVPWPLEAALGVMAALLAFMTVRSFFVRRRLAEAEHLARTDSLTGLPNRQNAEQFLETLVAGAMRTGRPLSLALMDLDHFKAINDDFGHAAGDATLRGVAHALTSQVRTADQVGRFGGEEFIAILPEASPVDAIAAAERIRERVAAMPRRVNRQVTASLGVASLPGDAQTPRELLAAADRALYAAKEAGRDQVVWAGALDAVSHAPAGADHAAV